MDARPVVPMATIAAPSAVAVAGGRRIDVLERERAEQIAEEGAELARRAGFAAAVLGSTAEGILRHAHRSVMVVPDSS